MGLPFRGVGHKGTTCLDVKRLVGTGADRGSSRSRHIIHIYNPYAISLWGDGLGLDVTDVWSLK